MFHKQKDIFLNLTIKQLSLASTELCTPVVVTTDLMFRKPFELWHTSCWNGFDVVLKGVMMICICGMF